MQSVIVPASVRVVYLPSLSSLVLHVSTGWVTFNVLFGVLFAQNVCAVVVRREGVPICDTAVGGL